MYKFFDFFFLLIFIVPFFFLFLFTFFLCFFFQGTPIFFKQARGGYLNKKIFIYKFRTMENNNKSKKMTNIGRYLRILKLDELPQILNILKGEMSIVGPRPLHYEYSSLYTKHQKKRFLVKPGLTGYSQVYLRNNEKWTKKFKYDAWYVKNRTVFLDFKIIIKTLLNILTIKDKETMVIKKFNGKN